MLYTMWWMLVGCYWVIRGIVWLLIIVPFKWLFSGGGQQTRNQQSSFGSSSNDLSGSYQPPSVGGGKFSVHHSGEYGNGPDCVTVGDQEYAVVSQDPYSGTTRVESVGHPYGESRSSLDIDSHGNVKEKEYY